MKSDQVIFQVKADKGEHRTMNFTRSGKVHHPKNKSVIFIWKKADLNQIF